MSTRQIQFIRGNTQCINDYVGPIGSLAINLDDWSIHIQDGVTPGGYIVSGAGGTSYGNANVAAYLIANGYLTSTTANLSVYAWNANLATYAWNSNVNTVISSLSNYALNANISNYGNTNVHTYLGSFDGNIIPSANSVYSLGSSTNQWKDLWVSNNTIYVNGIPLTINSENNLSVNGNVITQVDLGNFAFDSDRQYNINGFTLENSDLTHGYTSRLAVAPNGSGDASLENFYGNVNIVSGIDNGNIRTWTFGADGRLTVPGDTVTSMLYTENNGYRLILEGNNSGVTTAKLELDNDNGHIRLKVGNVSTPTIWAFRDNGNLTLPPGGDILDSNGVSVLGGGVTYGNVEVAAYLTAYNYITTANIPANVSYFVNDAGYITTANLSGYATTTDVSNANVAMKGYVDGQITNLVNGAPVILDTLSELANALGGDANLSVTVTSLISNVQANVTAANIAWQANANSQQQQIANIIASAYSNANVSSYLPVYGGNISAGNITLTGNITGNTAGFAIGYRDIPQIILSSNVSITTTDAGKHYYSTSSSTQTLTIANNATQSFSIGAAVNIINQGTGNIIITQDSGVSLYLAGNATASNRTLGSYGMATIQKVATDTWFAVGVGLA